MVGGAASVLSRRRAGALAGLVVALAAYGAGARHLPELPSWLEVVFHALVVYAPRRSGRRAAQPDAAPTAVGGRTLE